MKIVFFVLFFLSFSLQAQVPVLNDYDQVWDTQSKNSSESMPLGGGDIGANVWVEKGNLYFYFSRSGTFDEHNTLLKLGRVKISLNPNPFKNQEGFQQKLNLKEGYISITQNATEIKLWVDVFAPVIHIDLTSASPVSVTASYESWRYKNRKVLGKENNANSYKWAPQGEVITYADSVNFKENRIEFYHQNRVKTVFDVTVDQQQMTAVKDQMMNPLKKLTFGGVLCGTDFTAEGIYDGIYKNTDFKGYTLKSKKYSKKHQLKIVLHTEQNAAIAAWRDNLNHLIKSYKPNHKKTISWWNDFWKRSFIYTGNTVSNKNDSLYQIGQNYQLFRYMLAANVYGKYPTKFNGGLFTYDPVFIDSTTAFTPDFRNWGGGTMTAQNQRLVYWPMLKSGDFDMLPSQLDYYLSLQKNAELRSTVYWGHEGAAFTEQLENFGLPNPAEYEWKRPKNYDPGMQYNAWLEYEWDTVFEFCDMMLSLNSYDGQNLQKYKGFILSCIRFFDEHYQYLARKRGRKALDAMGHLVLYPGSAAETYKMANNANSTIAALRVIANKLIGLGENELDKEQLIYLKDFKSRIPPLNYREIQNQNVLAPAKSWERINNTESPQLYPVYPWGIYGIGKPDLQTAQNTFNYDPDVLKFRSHIGWKQDNIFAARLGLIQEASQLSLQKMSNSGRRFPAFWGPGFDWVPDHNWGGSGMIGMQEMLMQEAEGKIYLFPAWPKDWNVHFKLHTLQNTTVEVKLINGKIEDLSVLPKTREKDIISLLNFSEIEKLNIN
ncbi:DUF5703 domain-containing protein [Leeuwenhoekiella marinoflava]|uniref:DUF5703 domain-containing protein n=2 Tax=Leeuwenhoekiella marinoflava TaxID=988 RepID=A0A4Q0PNW5_9FLAO|nr:DUF5703 domain-containing protein [Leeuwenhoekiella marinoflava]RXG32207.1 hypothetical protein DSL99_1013 [Leeuwenhoekiella marinoflava]SHE83366.1 hypothetical protein SAMN02745246_01146 [Leeuwenhoekiella marinoflava DSM 3653]